MSVYSEKEAPESSLAKGSGHQGAQTDYRGCNRKDLSHYRTGGGDSEAGNIGSGVDRPGRCCREAKVESSEGGRVQDATPCLGVCAVEILQG
jgi:hypothetical protein